MDELLRTFLAILGGGFLVAVVQGWWNRRKVAADTDLAKASTADVLVGTAERLVETLGDRLEIAEAEIVELRADLEWTQSKAREAGVDIPPRPR